MSLAQSLASLRAEFALAANMAASAHRADAAGQPIFSANEREVITVSALLHFFKAWEGFLEEAFSKYLTGKVSTSGSRPKKFARPPNIISARAMLVGVMKYFDYANHENVRKAAKIYFLNGDPFETHLASVLTDLSDMRIMRNSAAHISSTTQASLEALAQRLFVTPQPNITLYQLLLRTDPRSPTGETIFASYQRKLDVTAELIARA